jgi:type I restriction enzyme, S subunit
MDAQQFLAKFELFSNAQAGVARLRELILTLAVHGRLVPQRQEDEPARGLLEKIRSEKEDLVKRGVLKRQKLSGPVNVADTPHQVPEQWAWVRLGAAAKKITDGTHHSPASFATGDFKYLSAKNIKSSGIDLTDVTYVPASVHREIYSRCDPEYGDVLYIKDGATTGVVAINTLKEQFSLLSSVGLIKPSCGLLSTYLALVMRSPFFYRSMRAGMKGVGITRVTLAKLEAALIPLPPLAEQSRIVAKVDELMALCDQLEKHQQARRKLQNASRQASLQAIAAVNNPHELQIAWTRLADNFGELFSTQEDVGGLRGLILNLAVRGLLVEQVESDEPVSSWLRRITTRKEELAKNKLIAKQIAFSDIPQHEYPFTVPKGWMFVRLGQITNKIGSGSTPRGGREVYVKEGVPFLRSQNVWNDGLRLADVAFITQEEHEAMSGTAVLGNDILLNITGASLGRCALVPPDFGTANVSQHVTIIRPSDLDVREYLHLCLLSPYSQELIWGRQVGMAREGLSKKVLEQFEIPMPPVAEQRRIIARVAKLMRLCDEIERQLSDASRLAQRLSAAAVSTLTGITTEQEQEVPVKAPQTEIIAPLRLGQAPDVKAQAPLATILARHQGEMSARDLWQRFGGEIDAFYAQLKTEVAHGWITEPGVAEMLEKVSDRAGA